MCGSCYGESYSTYANFTSNQLLGVQRSIKTERATSPVLYRKGHLTFNEESVHCSTPENSCIVSSFAGAFSSLGKKLMKGACVALWEM